MTGGQLQSLKDLVSRLALRCPVLWRICPDDCDALAALIAAYEAAEKDRRAMEAAIDELARAEVKQAKEVLRLREQLAACEKASSARIESLCQQAMPFVGVCCSVRDRGVVCHEDRDGVDCTFVRIPYDVFLAAEEATRTPSTLAEQLPRSSDELS